MCNKKSFIINLTGFYVMFGLYISSTKSQDCIYLCKLKKESVKRQWLFSNGENVIIIKLTYDHYFETY